MRRIIWLSLVLLPIWLCGCADLWAGEAFFGALAGEMGDVVENMHFSYSVPRSDLAKLWILHENGLQKGMFSGLRTAFLRAQMSF